MLLGVTQEQHADRCRLFAQWKEFDWPILHDPINVLEARAVPIVVAIDEHGIVRAIGPRPETFEAEFLDKTFADDAAAIPEKTSGPPFLPRLARATGYIGGAAAWRSFGDGLTLWAEVDRIDQAIERLPAGHRARPLKTAMPSFDLGSLTGCVTSRPHRHLGDFQAAVDAWGRAPSSSTPISTSGGVGSSNTAHDSPNRTRSTTGSHKRARRSRPAVKCQFHCWRNPTEPSSPDPPRGGRNLLQRPSPTHQAG